MGWRVVLVVHIGRSGFGVDMSDNLKDQRIANLLAKLDDAVWCIAALKKENSELRRKATELPLYSKSRPSQRKSL